MSHETMDIPQADILWDVALVPEAITRGKKQPDEIGVYIGTKAARQGLYYTQAARILGFVKPGKPGEPVELTPFGRAFATYNHVEQRATLRRMLLQREPTRSVVVAIRASEGLRRTEIASVLQDLAPLAQSTAIRRAATVAAWLCATGLARWEKSRLAYCGPTIPVQPSFPHQSAA
ncbi:MAG: AAA-associated domain-containing protein [Chloroflexales bacterium]|jgi:hypothetical protein